MNANCKGLPVYCTTRQRQLLSRRSVVTLAVKMRYAAADFKLVDTTT